MLILKLFKHVAHAVACMLCLKLFVQTCFWQSRAAHVICKQPLPPQVFQTFKWMLTTEQQTTVVSWVKKAVAATFTGKNSAGDADGMPAASSSSSAGPKAPSAKQAADTASVMHLFGN